MSQVTTGPDVSAAPKRKRSPRSAKAAPADVTPAVPEETAEAAPDALKRARGTLTGAEILDECEALVRRFWVAPNDAAYTIFVLWAAHTHAMMAFTRTPRLAILGDEPGVGKTRGLDLLALLCANASIELDPTGPAFAAKIASGEVTALLDETDTIWGKNGSNSGAMRTLRSILNSGYRRGAKITRKAGREWVSSPVFGPVAFAGMGNLPDTIMDRSVVIRMRKRKPTEKIDTYMPRMHEPIGREIGRAVGEWVRTQLVELANSWPDMPEGISDRKSEVAESILAIADCAGGHWPKTSRAALRELMLEDKESAGPTPAESLLRDIRSVWPVDRPRLSTAEIILALFTLDTAPWRSIWDPIAASRELSALLGTRGVNPRKIKMPDGRALQGYRREDFALAWLTIDKADEAARLAAESAGEVIPEDDTEGLDEIEED